MVYAESGQGINLPPSTLYTVDPVPNGADVQVGSGPIALPDSSTPVITDVAQSSTGQLFAISFDNLYSIDILTAQAQLVGPLGRSGFNALAFDRQGNLFAASAAGDWARVNIQTGAAQILGSYGSGFVASGDIVFVPSFASFGGTPYGTARTFSNVNDQLVKIDATSGQANLIMDLGTSN